MINYKLQKLQEFSNIKKIFFVGIKGVGMAPLAIIAKQFGINVSGSDIDEVFITDKYLKGENIKTYPSFDADFIKDFFGNSDKNECLTITTGAHKGFDSSQSKWSKENGIPVITQGQALSVFMEGTVFERNFKGIAVSGSHGKTTISSLLATTMNGLGLDCSYSVGTGELFPLGSPGHYGLGEYFIAEADEYASEPVYDRVPKFLYLNPTYAIFNNIDFDHPDLFSDISQIENAFLNFAHNIKSGGILFINGDDKRLLPFQDKVLKDIKIITYGKGLQNNYVIKKIVSDKPLSRFTVDRFGREMGVFELQLSGEYNCQNALSVIAFLTELGFEYKKIREALRIYQGSKRRMEILGGSKNGATLIDDYAHHPKEILTTISAIKKANPNKKIVAIFQPHTFSRTKSLLSEFAKSFEEVDYLLLLPVFRSQRDTEKDNIPNDEYLAEFKKYARVKFFENFDTVVKYCEQNFLSSEYIILTIGAGDVYKINEKLLTK